MRYGKVEHEDWLLEFRFNWKESKYDVFATHEEEFQHASSHNDNDNNDVGVHIGFVWKNPRKSRRKPCWEAYLAENQTPSDILDEFGQMRLAGIALLKNHLHER